MRQKAVCRHLCFLAFSRWYSGKLTLTIVYDNTCEMFGLWIKQHICFLSALIWSQTIPLIVFVRNKQWWPNVSYYSPEKHFKCIFYVNMLIIMTRNLCSANFLFLFVFFRRKLDWKFGKKYINIPISACYSALLTFQSNQVIFVSYWTFKVLFSRNKWSNIWSYPSFSNSNPVVPIHFLKSFHNSRAVICLLWRFFDLSLENVFLLAQK